MDSSGVPDSGPSATVGIERSVNALEADTNGIEEIREIAGTVGVVQIAPAARNARICSLSTSSMFSSDA
jgi:hypothetical protein